ncbi:TlpA disulfide reductase family protein [uncultured Psychroserpens sp.]|uniref:TlpA family protein disulfide reductase n=1 Tax=uncultured Psychroserpens sp. TaxID=255436 RepID=UPI0026193AFC|nr:TlpA disulfide reductase family protein [uncultured Psychroserpens sp.]
MKRLIIALFALAIFACEQEPKIDYAVLSGKVENSKAKKATLSSTDFKSEIEIKEDGTFSDTLRISENGFYSLSIGRESTAMYLKKGDNIDLTVDAKEFDETVTYSGEGSVENNYLAKKYLNNEETTKDVASFYSLEEDAYKDAIGKMKAKNLEALKALESADADFVATETENLTYDEYGMIDRYGRYHAYYAKKPGYEVSESFVPDAIKNMTFDNEKAYKSSDAYRSIAIGKSLNPIYEAIGDDHLATTTEHLKSIADIKIPALKNDIIDNLAGFLVSPGNPNMESLHNFFVSNATSEDTKKSLTEKFEKNKNLMKGKPSPQFNNYENHKGGEMSLADLKGKYVYVDVWATWCGPCIREIPSLKEVEKKFHNENIEFVSTSIDEVKDHDKWIDMVKDKDLGGVQLMADNAWKSKFVRDYAIDGIPRFILIDPNGNIVSADAPRPSNPKLVELLEEELKMQP